MLNLLTRWRLTRWSAVDAPARTGGESARYLEQVRRIESRLAREAPLDMETPPVRLRRGTLDALHEITLYRRRRPVAWWERPRVAAALAAVVTLLIGAVAGLLTAGSDPYARYGRVSMSADSDSAGGMAGGGDDASGDRFLAGNPWGRHENEPPAVLQIIYELDAMATDARRAADYLVSQFTAASKSRDDGNEKPSEPNREQPAPSPGGSTPAGGPAPSGGPSPNGGQAPRP